MPIPDYQKFMQPLLQYLSDGQKRSRQQQVGWLADDLQLTESQRDERLPSGKSTTHTNLVAWAATYLVNADLLERPSRGQARITTRGLNALADSRRGSVIGVTYLRRFPEFVAFQSQSQRTDTGNEDPLVGVSKGERTERQTPEEAMESAHFTLRAALATDLLERIQAGSPRFFEQLVLDLLVAMGYGGSRADAAQAVGGSGDGGVDGYIKEDKLGFDSIYLQAKRWKESVGRPVVQAFAGSLEGFRARKGVLITTSRFSQDAHDYVRRIETRIVLIDGPQLSELMIVRGVGVSEVATFSIMRVDEDYFDDA